MKSSKLMKTLTGLMLLIHTPAARAAHPELAKLGQIKFSAPEVSRYALDNGLIVYIVKDNTLPIIHMSAFTKSGNAYDPRGKIGISQMTAPLTCETISARPGTRWENRKRRPRPESVRSRSIPPASWPATTSPWPGAAWGCRSRA